MSPLVVVFEAEARQVAVGAVYLSAIIFFVDKNKAAARSTVPVLYIIPSYAFYTTTTGKVHTSTTTGNEHSTVATSTIISQSEVFAPLIYHI